MPRLVPAAVLALLGLAAAVASCATSSAVQEGSGGRAAALGGTSGGVRGCGVQSSDADCMACINARCCSDGQACGADPTCIACLDQGSSADACQNDRNLGTFMQCLHEGCALHCFGGGNGGAGGAGSAGGSDPSTTSASGAGGDPSNGTTTNAATTSATSGSTTAATTSSTSGAGGSTSSSTTATTSSTTSSTSSGGGPLTCNGVDGDIGCCDDTGVLHWCTDGQTVVDQPCTGGDVCGWNPVWAFYDCVPPPAKSDPSNTYPMACGG